MHRRRRMRRRKTPQVGTSKPPWSMTELRYGRERIEEPGGGRLGQTRRIEGREGAGGEVVGGGAETDRGECGRGAVGEEEKDEKDGLKTCLCLSGQAYSLNEFELLFLFHGAGGNDGN